MNFNVVNTELYPGKDGELVRIIEDSSGESVTIAVCDSLNNLMKMFYNSCKTNEAKESLSFKFTIDEFDNVYLEVSHCEDYSLINYVLEKIELNKLYW